MKKEISSETLWSLRAIVEKNGFVARNEFFYFLDKEDMCYAIFYERLLENRIPFVVHNFNTIFRALGYEVKNKTVLYEDFKKLGNWAVSLFINSKLLVKFNCQNCMNESIACFNKMLRRKFFVGEPICSKCINKLVTNTKEWKETNSKAQLIAQNAPGARERMAEIIKERFTDIEYRKKASEASKKVWERDGYREKMVDIQIKRMANEEYKNKLLYNTRVGGVRGFYKELFYGSSYELAFLLKEEHERGSLDHISRFDSSIFYFDKNGVKRNYYPDFLKDGKFLIEIKGYGPWIDLDNLDLKNKSAKQYCKKNGLKFRLVHYKDITHFWIKAATRHYKKERKEKALSLKNGNPGQKDDSSPQG